MAGIVIPRFLLLIYLIVWMVEGAISSHAFETFVVYVVNIVIVAHMFQNLHCSYGSHYIPCIDGCILQFLSIEKMSFHGLICFLFG